MLKWSMGQRGQGRFVFACTRVLAALTALATLTLVADRAAAAEPLALSLDCRSDRGITNKEVEANAEKLCPVHAQSRKVPLPGFNNVSAGRVQMDAEESFQLGCFTNLHLFYRKKLQVCELAAKRAPALGVSREELAKSSEPALLLMRKEKLAADDERELGRIYRFMPQYMDWRIKANIGKANKELESMRTSVNRSQFPGEVADSALEKLYRQFEARQVALVKEVDDVYPVFQSWKKLFEAKAEEHEAGAKATLAGSMDLCEKASQRGELHAPSESTCSEIVQKSYEPALRITGAPSATAPHAGTPLVASPGAKAGGDFDPFLAPPPLGTENLDPARDPMEYFGEGGAPREGRKLTEDEIREKATKALALVGRKSATDPERHESRGSAFKVQYPSEDGQPKEEWVSVAHVFAVDSPSRRFALYPLGADGVPQGLDAADLKLPWDWQAIGKYSAADPHFALTPDDPIRDPANRTADFVSLRPDLIGKADPTRGNGLEVRDLNLEPLEPGEDIYHAGLSAEAGLETSVRKCSYEGSDAGFGVSASKFNQEGIVSSCANASVSNGGSSGGVCLDSRGRVFGTAVRETSSDSYDPSARRTSEICTPVQVYQDPATGRRSLASYVPPPPSVLNGTQYYVQQSICYDYNRPGTGLDRTQPLVCTTGYRVGQSGGIQERVQMGVVTPSF